MAGGVGEGVDTSIKRKSIMVGLQQRSVQWSLPSDDVGPFKKAGGVIFLSFRPTTSANPSHSGGNKNKTRNVYW